MDSWTGCYDEGWQGDITADSFAHPAKISRALVRRIYRHAIEEGWLKPGDSVVDPFGGIGGTCLDAEAHGLHWTGVELEPKFVALAEQNLLLWKAKYPSLKGTGRIIQGDSRKLSELVWGMEAVVGSPPFAGATQGTDGSFREMSKAWQSDPQNAGKPGYRPNQIGEYERASFGDSYGSSPGQLGSMPEGKFEGVVSSPPFGEQQVGGGIAAHNGTNGNIRTGRNCGYQNQAESIENLSHLPMTGFDGVVSSPPYEGQQVGSGDGDRKGWRGYTDHEGGTFATEGQCAAMPPDTFWSAAKLIVQECHKVLKPSGVAIWVTKDFVRKGKRVPFSDQWQALCESCGFTLLCRHRAMLVKELGTQHTLDGGTEELTKERKSFFRRLAEKNGSPAIDWEDVICTRKAI